MSQRCIRPRDLRVSSLGRRVPSLGWSPGWSLSAALALAFALLWLLLLTPAGAQQIIEDTDPPKIVGALMINSPADGEAYRKDERIVVRLSFNEPVQVSGAPRLRLTIGDDQRWARYSAISADEATLSFSYKVKSGDRDEDDLNVKKNSLRLNGGAIVDGSGNAAKLKHKRLTGLPNHKVDGGGISGEPQDSQPSAPTGVTAAPIGNMAVTVTWIPNNNPCEIKRFGFRLYDLSDDSVVIGLSVRNATYTVTQLKASTQYEVEVRAKGCGKWSDPTYKKFTTGGTPGGTIPASDPKMPPKAPTDITVTKVQNNNSVMVSWTATPSDPERCAHSYYVLYFGEYKEDENNPLIRWNITGTSATVTTLPGNNSNRDLESGTQYEVYVVSRSLECGSGSPAAWTTYTHQ